jgi:hypothetical protein
MKRFARFIGNVTDQLSSSSSSGNGLTEHKQA